MSATDEQLHDQMMRWGAERDEYRERVQEIQAECDHLAAENERLRSALAAIQVRAAGVLDA